MNDKPRISVIVPVHNGAKYFDVCLSGLRRSTYPNYELIIVDDASTDGCIDIGFWPGTKLVQFRDRLGPAAARNAGALEATGDVLFFTDIDVLVQPDTLDQVADIFREEPHVSAIFGSYDDAPAADNFVSQYKNLYHHFIHQRSRTEASTFWSACGAIRREVFDRASGFDAGKFSEPSIEDIEMGHRLSRLGFQIRLEKEVQVKHLKRWTFGSLLYADIFRRAWPWSRLILESRHLANDLNLTWRDRASSVIAGLMLLVPLTHFFPALVFVEAFLLAAVILLNHDLYSFFIKRRGLLFALGVIPLQILYYLYSGFTFALCYVVYCMKKKSAVHEIAASQE